MALKTESKTLGSHEYTVTQLGAVVGRECLRRFVRVAGPAVGAIAEATGKEGGASAAVSQAVLRLVEGLSADDLTYFCDVFGPTGTVTLADGRKPRIKDAFADHFAGNYFEMVLWLGFCVEVNFGGFFSEALARVASALPVATAKLSS